MVWKQTGFNDRKIEFSQYFVSIIIYNNAYKIL